jgi:hypothetical protein
MPLFFILSGFIIHYVYAGAFAGSWRTAIRDFALARFCRLYPLFFALLLFYMLGRLGRMFYAHPEIGLSYASLTGSWWYWVVDGMAMPKQRYGVSLSISTEVFFYAVYALGLFRFAAIESVRLCAAALVGLCIAAYALLYGVFATGDAWETFVLARHPDFVSAAADINNSFYFWLIYISPYIHLPEFAVGCLTCQLYLLMRRANALAPGTGGQVLAWLGVAWLIPALVLLHGTWYLGWGGGFLSFVNFLHSNFLLAPGCSLLILALALGGSALARALAHWVPKYLGEISYSIYLGHSFALSFMLLVGLGSPGYVFTLGLMLVVAGASALYFGVERPARAWLRAVFSSIPRASRLRAVR